MEAPMTEEKTAEQIAAENVAASKAKIAAEIAAEEALAKAAEETMREMRAAMSTMMSSGSKMMQAFVDMRMSYLKVMRAGLADPRTALNIATKNANDLADAFEESTKPEKPKADEEK
jgi:hypothetical protein